MRAMQLPCQIEDREGSKAEEEGSHMKMVEKVARAIFDVTSIEGVTRPWESIAKGNRDLHMEWARAAIEAMRDPTSEMTKVEDVHYDYSCNICGGLKDGYQKMLEAALATRKKSRNADASISGGA